MAQRPNIVLIVTDQQRYDSLGCCGNPYAKTPHTDALAAESVVFHRHFTAASICAPSRAALFSGLLPAANGVWCNGVAYPRAELTPASDESMHRVDTADRDPADPPSHLPTVADLLGEGGYETLSIGKLHLTPTNANRAFAYPEGQSCWREQPERMAGWHGPYMGFEHVELTRHHGEGVGGHYGAWLAEHHPAADAARRADDRPGMFGVRDLKPGVLTSDVHPTTWVGERAAAHIEQRRDSDRPYFLWVGIPDPHHPWTPAADLADEFAEADYLPVTATADRCVDKPAFLREQMARGKFRMPPEAIPMIRRFTDAQNHLIDRAVGRIIATLRETGQLENTLVVFSSDHGDWLGAFGLGRKHNVASTHLNRTPLIVRFPGEPELAGMACGEPVSNVDLLPTCCGAAGIAPPTVHHGTNLRAVATGESTNRRHPVLMQCYGMKQAETNFSIVEGDLRYAWWPHTGERELYDLAEDSDECRNLANSERYGEDVTRLHRRLVEAHCATDLRVSGRISMW